MGVVIESDIHLLRQYLPFDSENAHDAFLLKPTIVIFMALSSAEALGISVNNLPGPGGGMNWTGVEKMPPESGRILINAVGANGGGITFEYARFIFIAEMAEQLMPAYDIVPGGNRTGASRGEAMSRILAEQFFPDPPCQAQCISPAPWVNGWLNSSPRPDYINQNPVPTAANPQLGGDVDGIGYGCGVLFINYLRYQLGYSLSAILTGGGTTFADTYKNLTGLTDNPIVALTTLLAKHYPPGGMNLRNNNPFPLL